MRQLISPLTAIIVAALLAAAGAIIETRITVAQLEVRVDRTEADSALLRQLPAAVARLEAKLDVLADEVGKLRAERATRR